ncbi:restriction endonuclease subunit S [Aerococcus urinae]|nr:MULTISPECIES: restriction endonuclease subunit S [Aerococcus]AEA01148.1 type I restriction modification DNA specificity domain protein [Aerococcus sp. Group 1]MBU5610589.1 restriction endonuclease subunit S [Aerococcus urinae]MCY3086032.1 restriction endonuclease subunit S [Aerococcus mictus]MDK8390781.1 restriction endonuclease subunit S [Aerococcus urinae]RAV72198.1 restriction endonuclease subunit S [Aerococcus mictus]
MAEERKQPELRFKGFTDDWIQDKLGNISSFNPNAELPSQFFYVDLESVCGTQLVDYKFMSKEEAPSRAKRLAKKGDIFYQTVRPYQRNNLLFNEDDNEFVFSTGYAQIRTNIINNKFLFYLLQTDKFVLKVLSMCTGTSYPAITSAEMSKVIIHYPKKQLEQIKIGELLNRLDFIITLEQQKIEKLELLKQYLLQNMFADESGYPNLRFRGYTGPWFKNKGKNIFKKITEKKQAHLPVLSATQDKGMVLRDEFNERLQYDRKNLSNYKVVRPGQFVVHLRSFQGGFAHSNYLGITSPAYTIFDFINTNEHNDIYWKFYFANDHFILLLEKVTYGIRDGRTINFSDFCTLNINFPSLSEQNKIAKLLFSLDSLINLRTTKLENLTSLKQKLLSSLFI